MTGSGTDRIVGSGDRNRAKARGGPRSLGAALREAGLGDAAPEARAPSATAPSATEMSPLRSYSARLSSAIAASRSPRLAVFGEPDEQGEPAATPIVKPTPTAQGVVSPPPWLRAARRGRWHARMMNTFGWAMTLVIAGSIIGLAGHYLGLSPALVRTTLEARQ